MAYRWLLRIVTLAIWAVAALCVTLWSLRFAGTNAPAVAATAIASAEPSGEPVDLARIFGPPNTPVGPGAASGPKAADPGTHFVLVGVVADRASRGVALIAFDGKAAKPYRVGTEVEEGYVLKSVAARSATLAPSSAAGAAFTLELAPPVRGASAPLAPLMTPLLPRPTFVPPSIQRPDPAV